ncbi:TPA: helix-hairpin-helix domain-containing protein, partial [Campylobacter jejuni]|nr:helix-hairpin-helix domain-containing protein [Campylobacter jejuni]
KELKSLNGIGEAKAKAILEYRKEANFTSIDDLKKVKGIGDKLFEKIKNDITIE